jgi:hypothetical protein
MQRSDKKEIFPIRDSMVTLLAKPTKQQFADRHVAPLGHIIMIPSQPVFVLFPKMLVQIDFGKP